MNELTKIRDISVQYNISARTLRYYEDTGLITSIRNDDYAYRSYDKTNIKKLEQILILRKLNISVKDIKRIFETESNSVILEVLNNKVENIDNEVALLQELKEIVMKFIEQIKKADFKNETDIKLLYQKAKEIETQLTNADDNDTSADINRLIEITEELDKQIPDIMIIKIPNFRCITSGLAPFEEVFGAFGQWIENNKDLFQEIMFGSPDFLTGKDGKMEWFWGIKDHITEAETAPYKIIDFQGGLYAVAVSVDGDGESHDKVREKTEKWLKSTNFEEDQTRTKMGHMIYVDDEIKKGLGYHQMNLYLPIKLKENI